MSPRYITVRYQQSQITNNFYNFMDRRRGGGKQKETEKELEQDFLLESQQQQSRSKEF